MAYESELPADVDRAPGRRSVAVDVATRAGAAWDDIRKLELEPNIAELEAVGLTVVEPERAADPGFAERLRAAIVRVGQERSGARLDLDAAHEPGRGAFGDVFGLQLYYLLFEDKVFQEAIVNPVALALSTYLLGESCIISNCLAGVKGPGGDDLGLHSDNVMIPAPFPPYAQVCNVTWALTDYDDDSGPLVYVPGSHRLCRHPLPGEGRDAMVPVRARAGSIIFWHGNLWHGALGTAGAGASGQLDRGDDALIPAAPRAVPGTRHARGPRRQRAAVRHPARPARLLRLARGRPPPHAPQLQPRLRPSVRLTTQSRRTGRHNLPGGSH